MTEVRWLASLAYLGPDFPRAEHGGLLRVVSKSERINPEALAGELLGAHWSSSYWVKVVSEKCPKPLEA